VRHGGKLLSLMEAVRPIEITDELATVGEYDFAGKLVGPMTAHPKVDPTTGEMVFFGYSPFPPYLRIHTADANGTLVRSDDVTLPAPVMMHDFAVSERRIVVFDLPAVFDLDAMLSGGEGIRWDPSNGARIGVIDRRAEQAEPTWIEVDPFFMFHVLNAHDDGPEVIVEGCRSPRLNVGFGGTELAEPVNPTFHRWRINAEAGTVVDEQLDDRPGDFPRINDQWAGHDARFGYVAHSRSWGTETVEFDGVVKHDLVDGTAEVVTYGPTACAGEAAFAPDPTRSDEDAGWLLNFVYEPDTDASDLVILDAQALEEVARIAMPRRVPAGFHGSWLPAAN
jgi:carotenoid cleavage dioxygenase